MLEIDLKAPTVAASRNVWRLFPGAGYKFLDAFKEQNVGYLDIPGFTFPSVSLSRASDLVARIALSGDLAMKARSGAVTENDLENFDNLVEGYANARVSQRRGALRQAIINFYEIAKVNDLVVIPEPKYNSRIWIGRFRSDRIIEVSYSIGGMNFKIPAREIDWINNVRENTVSTALSETLRTQHPFASLEKSRFVEVLSLAYNSFIYGDKHVSTIFNGEDFLDSDAALFGIISRLSAAACKAIDENKSGIDSDFLSILLSSPPIEYTCSQVSDIHSPGFTRNISGKQVAIVIVAIAAAMIVLGGLQTKADVEDAIDNMVVLNSAPDADPFCSAYVAEALRRALKNNDIDKTLKLCDEMRRAAERAKIVPSAKAVVIPRVAGDGVNRKHHP